MEYWSCKSKDSSGLLSLSILSVLLVYSLTPIKLAFMVTLMSVFVSISIYESTSSSFPSAALVISFSSGMMILFCYCATLSNHESKSSIKMSMVMLLALSPLLFGTSEVQSNPSVTTMNLEVGQMFFLVSAMLIVMIAMVCINKSMFNPQKSLMTSYLW